MEKKIDAYRLAYGSDKIELETAVLELLEDGWVPQGGVSVTVLNHGEGGEHIVGYYQAMILRK